MSVPRLTAVFVTSLFLTSSLAGEERIDLDAITKIRLEGFRNSKVMETGSVLTDRIGARLTGSPNTPGCSGLSPCRCAARWLTIAHFGD
jgi:hypothetical protein